MSERVSEILIAMALVVVAAGPSFAGQATKEKSLYERLNKTAERGRRAALSGRS